MNAFVSAKTCTLFNLSNNFSEGKKGKNPINATFQRHRRNLLFVVFKMINLEYKKRL